MRWILGLLVLINVGILIWGSLDDEQPSQPQLAAPGVGSIRLVGEPEQPQPQSAVPIPAPPRSSGVMSKPPEAAEPAAVEVAAATEPAPPVLQALPLPPAAPQAEVPPPVPPAETSPAPEIAAPVAQPEEKAEPRSKPARPRFCSRIGPFAKAADSRSLADYLEQRGGTVQLREETRSMHAGYWVMIPPHESRDAAKAVAETLRSKGIKDLWIIPRGEYQYAISLGVFSKQPNATKFAQRLSAKGFKVSTVDKLKERTAHWLSYEGVAFIPPTELRARVPEGVQAEDQDCP